MFFGCFFVSGCMYFDRESPLGLAKGKDGLVDGGCYVYKNLCCCKDSVLRDTAKYLFRIIPFVIFVP